jgi:hypothetical protein
MNEALTPFLRQVGTASFPQEPAWRKRTQWLEVKLVPAERVGFAHALDRLFDVARPEAGP